MPRPLKWSMLGAHTIILSENIHKVTKTDYVCMCGSNFYGSDVSINSKQASLFEVYLVNKLQENRKEILKPRV